MQQLHQHQHEDDSEFNDYLSTLSLPKDVPLFTTNVDLWPIYLSSFPAEEVRQYHNCHTCRTFIQRIASLVTVHPVSGALTSAVWRSGEAHPPTAYNYAINNMREALIKAQITGVFISSEKVLGTPVTGEWTHFAVNNPKVFKKYHVTAGQYAAEKKEDYRNVSRALATFKLSTLEQVTELLTNDALYRSEKVLGPAKWLFELKQLVINTKHQNHKKNFIWNATASAPAGFCHPRASMVGTLLEDLEKGTDFDRAAASFKAKMHPLQYQRPSTAPYSGAIAAAEKRVKELGVAGSLARRFATLDEMQKIWEPASVLPEFKGIFDHLNAATRPTPTSSSSTKITWQKFLTDVLPNARRIEVKLPQGNSDYVVFVGAVNPASPVIFQWNNHISWYRWNGGERASTYALSPGWVDASAICPFPYMWGEKNLSQYKPNVAFILKGAEESRNQGNAIFPETLCSEFHDIRRVLEAHSRKSKIQESNAPHVIGKSVGQGCTVRVHTSVVMQYDIDRWN